ncbi:MAG: ATP synthase F0 subunit B [Bdellovibrionales bacterium]|nr:ATP synthase F0 subunit B [Bdellovibrionales bacterium]
MDILLSLGVNQTIGYHFLLFLVVYLFLANLLFKPYFQAFKKRVEHTSGSEQLAERLISEAEELHKEYEKKARAVNQEHKVIFDTHRSEALEEHEAVVRAAKEKAQTIIEESKRTIEREIDKARTEISKEVNSVSELIVNRVVGKDLA